MYAFNRHKRRLDSTLRDLKPSFAGGKEFISYRWVNCSLSATCAVESVSISVKLYRDRRISMKKFLKKKSVRVTAFCITFAVEIAAIGAVIAYGATHPPAPTVPVTMGQILEHRGLDYKRGNSVASIKLLTSGTVHGKTIVIAGFGGGSVSGGTSPALLIGIGKGEQIQFLVLKNWQLQIRPGAPRIMYNVDNPDKLVYKRRLGKPFTDDYWDRDKKKIRNMSAQELLDKRVDSVLIGMDRATFDRVFGGTN